MVPMVATAMIPLGHAANCAWFTTLSASRREERSIFEQRVAVCQTNQLCKFGVRAGSLRVWGSPPEVGL